MISFCFLKQSLTSVPRPPKPPTRCSNTLKCGHTCPFLRNHACDSSSPCPSCSSEHDPVVDMVSLTTLSEHNADQDPLIALPCGHLFVTSTIDHLASQALSDTASTNVSKVILPICPSCNLPFHMIERYYKSFRHLARHNKSLLHDSHNKSIIASFQVPEGTSRIESTDRLNRSLPALRERLQFLREESLGRGDRKTRKRIVKSLLILCNDIYWLSKRTESISESLDFLALEGLRRCITASDHLGMFDVGASARLTLCDLTRTRKSLMIHQRTRDTAAICAKWVMISPSSVITSSQRSLAQAHHAKLTGQSIGSPEYRAPGGTWVMCSNHLFFTAAVEFHSNVKFTCTVCRDGSRFKPEKIPVVREMTLEGMQTLWLEGPWYTCPRGHLYTREGCDDGDGGECIDCGVHIQ